MANLRLNEIKYMIFENSVKNNHIPNSNDIDIILDRLRNKGLITKSQYKNISVNKLTDESGKALKLYKDLISKPIEFEVYNSLEQKSSLILKGITPISDESEIDYMLASNSKITRFFASIGYQVYDIEGDFIMGTSDDEIRMIARREKYPVERSIISFSKKLGIIK